MITPYFRGLAKAVYLAVTPFLKTERRLIRAIAEGRRLVVLNFHQVCPVQDAYAGPLHPDTFDQLAGFIRQTFSVRTFRELHDGEPTDRPVAILSFDDGFRSFVDYAMPILERHGLRANQNVIPSAVLGGRPFTIELADLLEASPASLLRTLRLRGFHHHVRSDGADARARFRVLLSNYLKLRPRSERHELWDEVRHHLRDVDVSHPTPMMDLSDVREASRTHEIGIHSYEHETMAYESTDYFRSDFELCRKFFRDTLGLPMDVYAFPNGLARDEQIDWLTKEGVRDVLLVGDQFSSVGAHVHPRFNIAAASLRELRLQVLGLKASTLF